MRLFLSDVSPPVRSRGAIGPPGAAPALLVLVIALLAAVGATLLGTTPAAAGPPVVTPSPATASPASFASPSSASPFSTASLPSSAALSSTAGAVASSAAVPAADALRSRIATTPASASASSPADVPSPSPAPTPSAPRLSALPSGLVTVFPLTVTGTADPGNTVDVSAGSSPGPESQCTATVDGDGRFACAIPRLPDGPRVPVRAVSRDSGLADSDQVAALSPPVITTTDGAATGGGIRGTAYPGAVVTVTAGTGASCTFPSDSSGTWGCVIAGLSDGRHTVTATQVAPFSPGRSATSVAVAIVLDTVPPPAPAITSPGSGISLVEGGTFSFAGTGETGDAVTVYASTADGTTVACTATVVAGAWSCSATLPRGDYSVSALQRDGAGNVSAGSNAIAVAVTAGATATAPPRERTPSPSPTPTPEPVVPPPAGTAPPTAEAMPHPDTKGWIDTPFTTASAPSVDAASVPGWLRSLALAIAALLLLVLPGRLLAAALAARRPTDPTGGAATFREPRSIGAGLFGRNRPAAELRESDALLGAQHAELPEGAQPTWLAPLVGVVAAALVTLSTSVQDSGAYLRLLIAVAIAIVAVNAVWVLAARGMARHLGATIPRVVVRPVLLIVVAATAIGSRLIGLEPALLFGLVLGALLPEGLDRVARGRIGAVQLSAVAALGVLAWLTVGVLPTASGSVSAFFVELANALALVGIGSTAVAILPFGGLAGRAVMQWSRPIWLGLSVIVYTVLFALLLPVASIVEDGSGMLAASGAALAFAVLCVSVWLWERYIEPAR